ncbi:hypothetical protein LZ32DRAFT_77432 [Colletotrichum eremochloae]|nr:hypothetical protein LZ32DRAFT_77432 [Colletotrichum eremochloae]
MRSIRKHMLDSSTTLTALLSVSTTVVLPSPSGACSCPGVRSQLQLPVLWEPPSGRQTCIQPCGLMDRKQQGGCAQFLHYIVSNTMHDTRRQVDRAVNVAHIERMKGMARHASGG